MIFVERDGRFTESVTRGFLDIVDFVDLLEAIVAFVVEVSLSDVECFLSINAVGETLSTGIINDTNNTPSVGRKDLKKGSKTMVSVRPLTAPAQTLLSLR